MNDTETVLHVISVQRDPVPLYRSMQSLLSPIRIPPSDDAWYWGCTCGEQGRELSTFAGATAAANEHHAENTPKHEATIHQDLFPRYPGLVRGDSLNWYYRCTCGEVWTERSTFRGAADAVAEHYAEYAA